MTNTTDRIVAADPLTEAATTTITATLRDVAAKVDVMGGFGHRSTFTDEARCRRDAADALQTAANLLARWCATYSELEAENVALAAQVDAANAFIDGLLRHGGDHPVADLPEREEAWRSTL